MKVAVVIDDRKTPLLLMVLLCIEVDACLTQLSKKFDLKKNLRNLMLAMTLLSKKLIFPNLNLPQNIELLR